MINKYEKTHLNIFDSVILLCLMLKNMCITSIMIYNVYHHQLTDFYFKQYALSETYSKMVKLFYGMGYLTID